ncbi:MAG TPA: 23S rRNA (pseudouridine(1915)-N(3))-methyltransferase RlmH [Gemmatimonadales bacterium]|nr:23S rRNA (pseudouridine(1915)-N(3))-methyltransferase RlmH [Gemmatimonadales bacterium]
MRITLLAVGRLRPHYRAACDDYLARLRRYARVTEREVREGTPARPPAEQRAEEAERLSAHLPPGTRLVALARAGTALSSEDLARRLERWTLEARPLAFAIGGSTGLADEFLARAELAWSLGPLTLPHELARVVVCEQLYRAFTILRGEPYHKGK